MKGKYMKTKLSILFAVLLVAFAALAAEAPLIDAHISSDTTAQQIRDARGPVNLTFNIAVTNRSEAPVTLTRVEVRTDDTSNYAVRDGSKKLTTVIDPSATENITLVAKAVAPRDLLQAEPFRVSVHLTFKGPDGKFTKDYSQFIE
jgi:uncharacterized protein YdeI (BOF family)